MKLRRRRVRGIGVPPPRRRPLRLGVVGVALVAGMLAGGTIGLLAGGQTPSSVLRPLEPANIPQPKVEPVEPHTLLAWTPGGLPSGLGRAVSRIRGVAHVVSVASGTAWLSSSIAADGTRVDVPPAGLAIPLEVGAATPQAYAPFLPPSDRALLSALERGEALLGLTEAGLRHIGIGGILLFGTERIRVAGIVPDADIGAHEVFVSRTTAAKLGIRKDRYLLIEPGPKDSRQHITSRIRALLPAGLPLRVRGPGETPFFRQGDAVLPPVRLKKLFGEFAARPAGGYLKVDPAWVHSHIVTTEVPIIGKVTCNRAIIPQLQGALTELEREGLAQLIDVRQYAGCYSSRFINRNPEAGISHHAWGVAIDINARRNVFGRRPHQDPRLVKIFEQWGFTWGGQWLVPDGMHFEFVRFPTGS
jgi:hypothetical protein